MVGLGCLLEGSPDPNPGPVPRCDAPSSPQLPKNLEVRPDDSEETALRKKKKLNMYKRQEKKEREEKQGEGRRSSWQTFAKKNKTTKAAKNGHDPRWDPTRDHGELAARQQMEKYSTFLAREGGS
jgi:hypothetical protein